jgi:hypothetical protein
MATKQELKDELQLQIDELQSQFDGIIEPVCTHQICSGCMQQIEENAKRREILLFKITSLKEIIEKL